MTQATDATGPSRSRQTLFYLFYCFITSPRILFVVISYFKAGTSNICSQIIQFLVKFLQCARSESSVLSTDSCPQIGTSNSCPNFLRDTGLPDLGRPAT